MAADEKKVALVLSAGAPHSPLMAGALCAFHEQNKTFDIIYTSGAGALIGLLFVAPKGKDPETALRGILELAIADEIYRVFPVNYKAFWKPGPFTRPLQWWTERFKLGQFPFPRIAQPRTPLGELYNEWVETRRAWLSADGGAVRRLYNDLIDMWTAAITPTTLNYKSLGLCDPLPFLDDLVDFDKLRNEFPGEFFINAFSPSDAQQEPDTRRPIGTEGSGTGKGITLFRKKDIDARHVRAAFAYPFIYTPVTIDGKLYFEGADRDPISFGNLLDDVGAEQIETLVLVDILGSLAKLLLRAPRDLWDAYGLSIIVPVVAHAQKEVARFLEARARNERNLGSVNFLRVLFDIPPNLGPTITDWSYSNMSTLFELGRQAGLKFCREHDGELRTRTGTGSASNMRPASPQGGPKKEGPKMTVYQVAVHLKPTKKQSEDDGVGPILIEGYPRTVTADTDTQAAAKAMLFLPDPLTDAATKKPIPDAKGAAITKTAVAETERLEVSVLPFRRSGA